MNKWEKEDYGYRVQWDTSECSRASVYHEELAVRRHSKLFMMALHPLTRNMKEEDECFYDMNIKWMNNLRHDEKKVWMENRIGECHAMAKEIQG